MCKLILRVAVLAAALGCPAYGQYRGSTGGGAVPWEQSIDRALAKARETARPIMLYVEGDTREGDERYDDDRRKALSDARVLYATRNFVPVMAPRSNSRYRALFDKLHVSDRVTYMVTFATPELEKLDDFFAVEQAESFAQKAALVFRTYRTKLFEEKL